MEQKELSPEQLKARKKTNKIILTIFLVILAFIAILVGVAKSNSNSETIDQQQSKYISGLQPIDVYINLENNGFKTEKTHDSDEYGSYWLWKSTKLLGSAFDATVETFSDNSKNVISIRATIMSNANVQLQHIDTSLSMSLFNYLSTLPFETNSEEQISQTQSWIAQNINNDQVSMHFGDVKITIYAPSDFVRTLYIEKFNNN